MGKTNLRGREQTKNIYLVTYSRTVTAEYAVTQVRYTVAPGHSVSVQSRSSVVVVWRVSELPTGIIPVTASQQTSLTTEGSPVPFLVTITHI